MEAYGWLYSWLTELGGEIMFIFLVPHYIYLRVVRRDTKEMEVMAIDDTNSPISVVSKRTQLQHMKDFPKGFQRSG